MSRAWNWDYDFRLIDQPRDLTPRERKAPGQGELPGMEEEPERIRAAEAVVPRNDPHRLEIVHSLVHGGIRTALLKELPPIRTQRSGEQRPGVTGLYRSDLREITLHPDAFNPEERGDTITHEIAHHFDMTVSPQFKSLEGINRDSAADREGFATGVEAAHTHDAERRRGVSPTSNVNGYDDYPGSHFEGSINDFKAARAEGYSGFRPQRGSEVPGHEPQKIMTHEERGKAGQQSLYYDWDRDAQQWWLKPEFMPPKK